MHVINANIATKISIKMPYIKELARNTWNYKCKMSNTDLLKNILILFFLKGSNDNSNIPTWIAIYHQGQSNRKHYLYTA